MAGRSLGIDFGERRIGLAISDERNRIAVPLTVVERHSDASVLARLRELVARENVGHLVVGDPLRLDGKVGDAARRARSFARKLARATALPLEMIPEALTSVAAEAAARPRGAKRRRPNDALAAQILLQEALDRRHRATALEEDG